MPTDRENVSSDIRSDNELAALVKSGDNDAFEELASRYINFLYSLSHGFFVNGFDKYDFAQEGLLILLAACKTYNPNSGISFKNYFALCVKRRYISIQRSANAKSAVPASDMVSIDDIVDYPDPSRTPEEAVIKKEYVHELLVSLDKKLSALEKNVLMHLVSGCTYAQTAERLGITVKSVDNAMQRVKAKLGKRPD